MDNLDEFLAPEPEVEVVAEAVEAPEAEAPVVETEEKPDRPRAPDGKFAKKDAPVMVPLTALHETRDELKALKAELEQLRPQPAEPPKAPDIFEDPEGFTAHQTAETQRLVWNATLNMSEAFAKRHSGVEAVEEAKQWAAQELTNNPMLLQQFHQQPDPYGFLVDEHKRATTLAKITGDPTQIEAFLAWQQAQVEPQPIPAPVAVPETLADAQSARGSTPPLKVPTLDEILGRQT